MSKPSRVGYHALMTLSEDSIRDFYHLDSKLTPKELVLRDNVANWVAQKFMPRVTEYWESGDLPRSIAPELGSLGVFGSGLEGYGGEALSPRATGVIMRELERGDSGLRTFASVQSSLAMNAISFFGTQAQKNAWLSEMRSGEKLGCFALSEPEYGSNPGGMETLATRDGSGWILNGRKKWIGNGDIADVAVVWAKTVAGDPSSIRGFLVDTSLPGFESRLMPGKLSLRCARTSELSFDQISLPADALMENSPSGLSGPLACLNEARYGIAWGMVGASEACLREVRDYVLVRESFEKPLAGFQLVQDKLAEMLTLTTHSHVLVDRLSELKAMGGNISDQISLAKYSNVDNARRVAALGRDLLGGVGILLDHCPIRHLINLESVATYEGTRDIHRLVLGRRMTGMQAFR